MKKLKKIMFLILAVIGLLEFNGCKKENNSTKDIEIQKSTKQFHEITATQLVKNINAGWNLGNTLDSIDGTRLHDPEQTETSWGNNITTEAMIKTVAEGSFKAVRVPVTYYDNCDENANIDSAWLDRVETVVDYVLDNGMYCIIDVHHDTGMGAWITADEEDYDLSSKRLQKLWEQIAERFKNYDERLIFEGFNELINDKNEWDNADDSNYEVTNKLNQVFVDCVRKTGGNNAHRILMVNLYAAIAGEKGVELFNMPNDSASDAIIVGFHSYSSSETELDAIFERMQKKFVNNNIPVIMGEFGTKAQNSENSRAAFAGTVVKKAHDAGIVCFWWDDGGTWKDAAEVTNYALLNRIDLTWYFPKIKDTIIQTSEGNDIPTFIKEQLDGEENVSENISEGMEKISYIDFGTEYNSVETEICLSNEDDYKVEFEILDSQSYGYLLQANEKETRGFEVRQEQDEIYVSYGYNRFNVGAVDTGKKYSVMQDKNDTYYNDEYVKCCPVQEISEALLVIGNGKFRFYGMDISNNGVVIHHLVPVSITTEKKVAILDTVSGDIYAVIKNSGEKQSVNKQSSDVKNEDSNKVIESTKVEGKEIDESKKTILVEDTELPSDITKVDYIEIEHPDGKFVTGLSLGIKDNYEILFELLSADNYGQVISAATDERTCYEIRQEQNNVIVSYGYNRFEVGNLQPEESCVIVQENTKTFFNGALVQTCPIQEFEPGVLRIGECGMRFYGMNIYNVKGYSHQLIPALDEKNDICIYDIISGDKYYSSNDKYITYKS